MSLKLNKDILCLLIRLVYCIPNFKKSMNRDIYGCILAKLSELQCKDKLWLQRQNFFKREFTYKSKTQLSSGFSVKLSQKTIRKCYWILNGKVCDHSNTEVILRYAKSTKT